MTAGDTPAPVTVADPVVSVLVLAYNHGAFLADAILGATSQICPFPYEVVVGVDLSDDETAQLALRLATAHPDCVRVCTSSTRMGMWGNLERTLKACRGEFIALLEGDDYWTNPNKLARQVAMLKGDPCLAVVGHAVLRRDEGTQAEVVSRFQGEQRRFTLRKILGLGYFVATCSLLYRASALRNYPTWYHELPYADHPLLVHALRSGDLGYDDEIMGVYRIHSGGLWSGADDIRRLDAHARVWPRLERMLGRGFRGSMPIARVLCDYSASLLRSGARLKALRPAFTALMRRPLDLSVSPRTVVSTLARILLNRPEAAPERARW